MPTHFVSGDLFADASLPALAHGVNCAGAMGKGIAVEFRARFPAMYRAYRARCAAGDFEPGDVFAWRDSGRMIFNLATQASWRTGATLEAVAASVRTMTELAAAGGIARVGMPRIGAGLGGLPWVEVRALLDRLGSETRVELRVFETYVPRLA